MRPTLLIAAALALTACSSGGGSADGQVVELMADYPTYDAQTLVSEADLIVEGTVVASESTVLTPRYEGGTPQENPLLGLSEEEKMRALEQDDGVPATAVTLRVDRFVQGPAGVGDQVVLVQTGGVVDGTEYRASGTPVLAVGETYLLFPGEGHDGTYSVLGGSAGAYVRGDDARFTPVDAEAAPFDVLSESAVESLTG